MAKVKLKRKEKKDISSRPPEIKPKNNIASDTLFVSDPKDVRIKGYQDSLKLYGTNANHRMLSKAIKEGVYKKDNPKSYSGNIKPIQYYKANIGNIVKMESEGRPYTYFQPEITKENSSKFYYDEYKTTRDRKTGEKVIANIPIYKKPTQPVRYKKSEEKKEEQTKINTKPSVTSEKQNAYDGSPVYSPGAGSGMPSALVGFRGKDGEVTYIKPEDYKRFAVPEYGKKFIESKNSK